MWILTFHAAFQQLLARITAGVDPEKADFSDFVRYVVEHEKQLEGIFRDLDRNSDGLLLFPLLKEVLHLGLIDVREIKSYCDDLGVPLTDAKAQNILDKLVLSPSSPFLRCHAPSY